MYRPAPYHGYKKLVLSSEKPGAYRRVCGLLLHLDLSIPFSFCLTLMYYCWQQITERSIAITNNLVTSRFCIMLWYFTVYINKQHYRTHHCFPRGVSKAMAVPALFTSRRDEMHAQQMIWHHHHIMKYSFYLMSHIVHHSRHVLPYTASHSGKGIPGHMES